MLISEHIAQLQALQTEHGDLPVYRPTNEGWRVSLVTGRYTEVVTNPPPEHPDEPPTDDSDGNELPPLYVVIS